MNTSADKLTETFNKFNFPEIFSNLVYYEPWDVYHWVFNERCSAIVKDNIKDAFANINRCIRCAEKQKPGPGAVSFKEPYCIGCKARVLAEEQLWISDMKKKKKLEEEEAEGGSTSRKSRAPLPQSYEEWREQSMKEDKYKRGVDKNNKLKRAANKVKKDAELKKKTEKNKEKMMGILKQIT